MRRSIAIVLGLLLTPLPAPASLEVPGTYATIQEAIDAADEGDVVRVGPGIYTESVRIAEKAVVLTSHYATSGDPTLIDRTVIDGGGGAHAIEIAGSVGPGTEIRGFTIRNARDGVRARGRFDFLNNRVTGNDDGIDYESGSGGLVRDCTFEHNVDDGIDLDHEVAVVIAHSTIRNNGNDGIEVRLHDYTGPELAIVIRDNLISGNGEDGIQLIADEAPSSRVFRIERNLFANNAMAAIGMMCCMETAEDFQGASLAERIYLFDNTFVGNDHGVTGGDNAIALNNIFAGTTQVALKRLDGRSIAAYNLFFANGSDFVESNADGTTSIRSDPLLDADHRPSHRSPAIDAGTAFFEWNSEVVLNRGPGEYSGFAPDLGAFEAPARGSAVSPRRCGLGAELLLGLTPVLWLHRRRWREGTSFGREQADGASIWVCVVLVGTRIAR
jgi:hypothetical protein